MKQAHILKKKSKKENLEHKPRIWGVTVLRPFKEETDLESFFPPTPPHKEDVYN